MNVSKYLLITLLAVAASHVFAQDADLVKMAQKELIALGYEPGNIQGEMDTATTVAISKFQAEQSMEITGEVTPQLVGALRAAKNQPAQPAAAAAAPAAAAPQQALTLQQRQQACLQEKAAAAQERNKKKRGMMKLLSAVTRTSRQFGDGGLASDISRTANEVYNVNATANDLEQAGKDLGLTPDEMEACRNPQ
ncbi:MAG: peptidoglycan-binding protein [Gammaproteobacteria bacterium]|nr:peptidoglycan-binding protein [Gammaproteobacteria bacterium]